MKTQPFALALLTLLAIGCLDGTQPRQPSAPVTHVAAGSISVTPATPHTARLTSFSSAAIQGEGERTWDFGDGDGASGVDVGHVFLLAGSYRVTVSLRDGSLASTTIQVTDVVKPPDSLLIRR